METHQVINRPYITVLHFVSGRVLKYDTDFGGVAGHLTPLAQKEALKFKTRINLLSGRSDVVSVFLSGDAAALLTGSGVAFPVNSIHQTNESNTGR